MLSLNMKSFTQYLCFSTLLLLTITTTSSSGHVLDSLHLDELYYPTSPEYPVSNLPHGDSEFLVWHLDNPINFYSEKYDQLFINTNGILTFNIEFPDYINQPFPFEYPSIAGFYSNVDTTGANDSTSISIFNSQDPEQLQKVSELVRYAYNEQADFEATDIVVATWKNVGYFESKTDKLNTFQVIIISDDQDTFVQFLYPSGGLNWLQGENGPLGLPDIRAQAGFVSEDGRYFNLEGSGTDIARFLSEKSNVGIPGVYLYRVGPFDYERNVQSPTNEDTRTESPLYSRSCSEAGQRVCSQHAQCVDKEEGFCCVCQQGFYGNGEVCIKDDFPVRVTGSIMGELNGEMIDERSKLQSYVVTADGRSYTAVTPINTELGTNLRLALPIVSAIGWLFAKPLNHTANGYQLTGGEFLHTSKLSFETGEVLLINQTYEGLNYWDQLSVKIDLHGQVPQIKHGLKLHMAEFTEEYRFVTPNELHSVQAHALEIPEENRVINFQMEQNIYFERCLQDQENSIAGTTYFQKISKIMLDYFDRDQALRTSILTVAGVTAMSNACTDGTAVCGENMVCIPYDDNYRCDCLHGYAPQVTDWGAEICVDIDECALGTHACSENGICTNNEGGFSCVCLNGYEGNGFRCLINDSNVADNIESSTPSNVGETIVSVEPVPMYPEDNVVDREHTETVPESVPEQQPQPSPQPQYPYHSDDCYRCSPYADCLEGRCECREGFSGDGLYCMSNCGHDEAWEDGRCVKVIYEEPDIEPRCNFFGDCTCDDGYELMEDIQMCRYVGSYNIDHRSEDFVPCDVEYNCHPNASCEWFEVELRHICTCKSGYYGDGYNCAIIDESCAVKPEICDPQAECLYNEVLGHSECKCKRGYEGDGYRCTLAPECLEDLDCGQNAFCDRDVCQCQAGFERDMSDLCVVPGSCGSVVCGANALCKYDQHQDVKYCDCMDGYEGDALVGCKSKPIPCNVQFNCGVHASCEPTDDPANYECQCNAGYNGDGYVCVEDQNCLNTPQLCDMNAACLSTNNGLVCVCNKGFYGNGSLCIERQQHDSGFLLVSQGVVIVRVPLNGKNVRPISVASMAIGLDKDCVEGRIYWGDISAKKIVSAKYDGTDMKPFITEDIESPEGIAIDCISRRLYWTDSVKDTIEVASLEDPTLRAVIINKNLVNPRGIAVDPYREKLYWSDWNRESPKIEVSDLDGTGREVLLGKDSVTLPNSLVVLERSGELCYADAGTKKVECIDSYTKQIRTISNELTYPFGLSFTHDQFYWTDWTTKKLESVDTLGQRQKSMQIPFFGSHKMYAMTAVEDHCPQMDSPCQINNGGCSDARLCLVNRKAPSGKSCKCTALSKLCTVPNPFTL
ncbi:nidogen [Lucilia cuprina]|uniref:nidogen n=1 Tax=Lucilia cuprina TaxID=7375 RepID=UPI001F06EDBA|nr:nidogen [Lucilia cuprina]